MIIHKSPTLTSARNKEQLSDMLKSAFNDLDTVDYNNDNIVEDLAEELRIKL